MPLLARNILTIFVFVLLNGLFAALELAVLTLDRNIVRRKASDGDRRARVVQGFLTDSSRFLATIQIAITLSGFLASATAAAVLATPLAGFIRENATALAPYATAISVVIVTLIITFLTLVLGELVPKRLGMQLPQRIAFGLARPVSLLSQLLTPVNALLTWSTNSLLRVMGVSLERPRQALDEEGVRRILRERAQIPKDEMELIGRVFEFGDHVAKEVMVPRTQMVTVSGQATLARAVEIVTSSGHSRLPIVGDSIDNVIGLAEVKDMLPDIMAGNSDKLVEDIMRPAVFFPDTKLTNDLLKEMQLARAELVILIDEYGGVAGIISIEDLVEELVGEIRDPFDPEEVTIKKVGERSYVLHGATDLEAVNSQLGLSLETRTAYETIGGFMLSELGRIPEPGEELERSGVVYRVEAMSDKRIDLVRITLPEKAKRSRQADQSPPGLEPEDEKDTPGETEEGPYN